MIINADDLGLSAEVNRAIYRCFVGRYCSSATLMANMPGFEEACNLVHEKGLLDYTGIHFVLTEGMPLTARMGKCPSFCDREGRFLKRNGRIYRLIPEEEEALAEELRTQVQKCRRQGIPITHADSHHHIHEEWAIAKIVMRVCREEGIPYIRIARNCGLCQKSLLKKTYRSALNARLRRAGVARTRYFGSAADFPHLVQRVGLEEATCSVEIMLHPAEDAQHELVESTSGQAIKELANLLEGRDGAVSFSGRRYGD